MQIGLFGGTFNPPHLAHLIVAELVRERLRLDQVLWIPAAAPPHKRDTAPAPAADRLMMTRLAVESNPFFAVSEIELRRQGVSYTVDTLRQLQDERPNDAFLLILGGDSLSTFNSWHRPDEIAARVPLVAYRRPGADLSALDPHLLRHVRFVDAPLIEISGTDIRARIREGRSIRYLVPERVRAYIEANRLYRS